ncbi:MAG: hypothetical protein ACREVO_08145 [Steroidobacteraceae bacterium]
MSSRKDQAEAAPENLPLAHRLDPERLRPAETVRRTWWATVTAGTPPDRLLDGRYWSQCLQMFHSRAADQPPDRIECMPPDRSWFLELMVLSVGGEELEVIKVAGGMLPDRRVSLLSQGPRGTNVDDFEFHDLGPGEGWAVVRKHDKQVMHKCRLQSQCAPWLSTYLRTVRT